MFHRAEARRLSSGYNRRGGAVQSLPARKGEDCTEGERKQRQIRQRECDPVE